MFFYVSSYFLSGFISFPLCLYYIFLFTFILIFFTFHFSLHFSVLAFRFLVQRCTLWNGCCMTNNLLFGRRNDRSESAICMCLHGLVYAMDETHRFIWPWNKSRLPTVSFNCTFLFVCDVLIIPNRRYLVSIQYRLLDFPFCLFYTFSFFSHQRYCHFTFALLFTESL